MAAPHKHRIKVDAQGRALVPKPLRDALGLQAPGEAIAWVEGDRLVLEPRASLLERVRARYRDADGSLAEELVEARDEEAESEDGRA